MKSRLKNIKQTKKQRLEWHCFFRLMGMSIPPKQQRENILTNILSFCLLVDLSEFGSNKYKTILQEKNKILSNMDNQNNNTITIIPDNKKLCNKEINEFGETAAKRLTQPYRKKFSDEEIEQIVSDYKSGETTIELGKKFNCGKTTINKLLRNYGVNVTKAKAQAKLDVDKVISMYKEWHTIKEIAKYFGVSSHTIKRCLHNNDVTIRNRWDYVKH